MRTAAALLAGRSRAPTVVFALVFFVCFSLITRYALTTSPTAAAAARARHAFASTAKEHLQSSHPDKQEDLQPPSAQSLAFEQYMQNSLPPLPPPPRPQPPKQKRPSSSAATAAAAPAAADRTARIERLYAMGHIPWLEYIDALDDAGLAPLTKLAQRWIYEKQHPPRSQCARKRYMVSAGTQSIGLGAYLHKQGFGLGAALEFDHLFVLAPVGSEDGKFDFADNCAPTAAAAAAAGSHDTPPRMSSLECFTQPLSSCTYEDAKLKEKKHNKNGTESTPNMWFGDGDWSEMKFNNASFAYDMVPTYLRQKLIEHFPGAELTPAFFKIWWRGQSAAYLSRLNAHTSDALRAARTDPTLHRTWTHNDDRPHLAAEFPLPQGTMNLHVRHGDKASEMQLIPFGTYVAAAERFSSENPQMYLRRLFVSSEDPGVIEDAAALPRNGSTGGGDITSPDARWRVYTSDIPRVNSGPYQQIRKYGASNMTRAWFLQLWMALECDVWFGTRASNWNRIIDEFRCIFVDKCQLPYFEMGPAKDWKGYFW
ncbi:hypothetical protein HDU86_006084 [Geranomyces michiganensis]|nr:hypothetical protein HDU86_006084 [Geranomyces michiganensis]